jgi:hypothetical protein
MRKSVEQSIVDDIKEIIERGCLEEVQEYWMSITTEYEFDQPPDFPWVIQKIFIHACLHGKRGIAEWLRSVFNGMDEISKIAYKHTLNYGDVLLRKKEKR